ncbi:MAG: alpha/beta fold hydrolase [Haliscomenobacter sp.]
MEKGNVVLSGGHLHFCKWGVGRRLLIAVHGFEGNGALFAPIGTRLPADTCLYAPDLPWHGQTQWHKASFSPSDFIEMVDALCTHAGVAAYTALGFSLGGRLWIGSLPGLEPSRLQKLVLLAPDGLASRWERVFSMLYAVFRHSRPERWLLRPQYLNRIAAVLQQSGLLPAYALRFLERNLQSEAGVQRLLNTWHMSRRFPAGFSRLEKAARTTGLPVVVVTGLKDPLIHAERIQRGCAKAGISYIAVPHAGHALFLRPEPWIEVLWE